MTTASEGGSLQAGIRHLHCLGCGSAGRAMARLLASLPDVAVGQVRTRSLASAGDAVRFIGAGTAVTRLETAAMAAGDLLLLALPDDRIGTEATALAASLAAATDLDGVVALHLSGSRPAAVLEPLAAAGAVIASVHPLRSFADPLRVVESFDGSHCTLEGEAPALAVLEPLLRALGARCLRVRSDAKLLYHAASVFASNYAVVLLESALELTDAAGLEREQATPFLVDIMASTAANVRTLGPAGALSGPVRRGDHLLVDEQLAAVEALDAALGNQYAVLAEGAVRLREQLLGADAAGERLVAVIEARSNGRLRAR